MKLTAYVINLDRRPDRFIAFEKNFMGTNFVVNRVPAVDGGHLPPNINSPLSSSQQACWLSHLKVIDMFIESEEEHCLVFEDDAVPSTRSMLEIEKTISQVLTSMKQHSIPFVQLGHIVHLYKMFSRQGVGHRIVQIGLGLASRTLKVNATHKLLKSQCRAGTHALLLSRKAALALRGVNNPPVFGADDFYMAVAQNSISDSSKTLLLATLVPSLFDQESRIGGRILDSDVV
tara:strand:+ start:2285 stop:2980 length:696 start_codon:yes stop_codon:yes gene_type:complete